MDPQAYENRSSATNTRVLLPYILPGLKSKEFQNSYFGLWSYIQVLGGLGRVMITVGRVLIVSIINVNCKFSPRAQLLERNY